MFEVGPNLWLQSFASPLLQWFMLAVTTLGYDWFYIVLIVVLGFGLRLRPTLGMMLALLLAGLATHAVKTGFEMPRPSDVDIRVLDKGQPHLPLVAHGGADRFLGLPSPEARAAIRASPEPDYGFISGHVAAATAMSLGLLLCFRVRKRALWVALCAWPIVMVLSRMYLGRHFLGDALGGLLAGGSMALLAAWLLPRQGSPRALQWRLGGLAIATAALCLLTPLTSLVDGPTLGKLGGLVIVLGVLGWRGFPDDGGTLAQRAGRIACVCAVYVGVKLAVRALAGVAGWDDDNLVWLPVTIAATAAMFLGGIALAKWLGLFRSGMANATRGVSMAQLR